MTIGIGKEYSAGGVVARGGKVLLVRVRNLQGRVLWTFPKGHIEPGETPRAAALREVEEETGWRCRIAEPLTLVRYHFMRGERRVAKRVRWYRMEPEVRAGDPDAEEVLECRWAALGAARRLLRYPGDFRLVELMEERLSLMPVTDAHIDEVRGLIDTRGRVLKALLVEKKKEREL